MTPTPSCESPQTPVGWVKPAARLLWSPENPVTAGPDWVDPVCDRPSMAAFPAVFVTEKTAAPSAAESEYGNDKPSAATAVTPRRC